MFLGLKSLFMWYLIDSCSFTFLHENASNTRFDLKNCQWSFIFLQIHASNTNKYLMQSYKSNNNNIRIVYFMYYVL